MIGEIDFIVAKNPETIGRYRITGELGRGGMGVVYRAVDPQLDRPVAVKRISLEGSEQISAHEMETRFLREARLAARLHHSAVATVFDAGRDGDALFLVMELVEGESLQRRLARGVFPSAQESLELAAQVADALAAAHQSGIIHRDVKPANILLTRGGAVKVSDFGVAKAIGDATELTRSGTVLGSPAYMAPEQIQGQAVDTRADIFSLGVVLYEMLLHRRPFPADTVTTLIYQILHQDPLDDPLALRALGSDLAVFLRQCLAKNPAERLADAATFARRARELGARLATGEQVATGATVRLPGRETPVAAPLPLVDSRAAEPARGRAPLWIGLAVGALGATVLGGAYFLLRSPPAPEIGRVEAPVNRPAAPASRPVETPPAAAPAVVTTPPAIVEPEPDSVVTLTGRLGEARVNPVAPRPVTPAPAPVALPSPAVSQPEPAAPAPAPATVVAPPAPFPAPAPALKVSQVFHASKGAQFNVSPEEAIVTVNGRRLGTADDWDGKGGGKTYQFPGPGTYDVLLTLEGYEPARIQVVVSADAEDDVADVDTELQELENR
jgi:serine/threonine-protein kinase